MDDKIRERRLTWYGKIRERWLTWYGHVMRRLPTMLMRRCLRMQFCVECW